MWSELQIRPHVCSPRPLPHQPITWRVSQVHGPRIRVPRHTFSSMDNIISETHLLHILQWPSTTLDLMRRLPTLVSQLQRPRYNKAHPLAEIITASFSVPPPTSFTTIFFISTQGMVSTDSCAMTEINSLIHVCW